jgi:hypothetical protein
VKKNFSTLFFKHTFPVKRLKADEYVEIKEDTNLNNENESFVIPGLTLEKRKKYVTLDIFKKGRVICDQIHKK